jgi:serine/threonine-protein kinase
MKPANVMIKPDGDVKLIDFGIAREYKDMNIADTTVLGTVGYAPPEQFGGSQTDARADIYALGATLYHAVTGHGPAKGQAFVIEPIRKWNPKLSGGLEKIILKCTAPKPENRYQNCLELMYDLEHYKEVDEAFLTQQRKKVMRFIAVGAAALVFIAFGAIGQGIRFHEMNSSFEQNRIQAQNADYNPELAKKAVDDGTSISEINSELRDKFYYYLKMVEVKPMEEESYLAMIETLKQDAVFDTTEEQRFLAVLTKNQPNLQKEDFYPNLAFEVGRLYWYYYAYGRDEASSADANNSTRMVFSKTWFKEVMDYGGKENANYEVANIYYGIGDFHEKIDALVPVGGDAGEYGKYWTALSELMDIVSGNDDESEIVRLTSDSTVLEAIATYARKFKSDGVTESEMEGVLKKAEDDVLKWKREGTTTDKTEEIQKAAEEQVTLARAAIQNAFRVDDRRLQY